MSNFVCNDDTVLCSECYDDIYPAGSPESAEALIMGTTLLPCGYCGDEKSHLHSSVDLGKVVL